METVGTPGTEDEAPESAGCTLGMLFGLLLLGGLIAAPFLLRTGGVDGQELLAEVFGDAPPAGFEPTEAARRATGEEVLQLERTGEEDPPGPTGGPTRLVLVRYTSKEAVERLFRVESSPEEGGSPSAGGRMAKWMDEPDFAWHTTVEAGDIHFGVWQSDYVIERAFSEDGTWEDAAWVDLSRGKSHVVLFALWPPESPGSRSKLEELLAHANLR